MPKPQLSETITKVGGFRAAGVAANLKTEDKLDMALIVADRPCVTAAVFTKNAFKAAPVLLNQAHLGDHAERIRAVIVNTANANAGTGAAGVENARTMARLTAEQIGCETEQILVLSTGVVGMQLPMEKIRVGIQQAPSGLGHHWDAAAKGMMTTDTRHKMASLQVITSNGTYTIAGITKGSGMIAPNMATTLGIIVTDAKLSQARAQQALTAANEISYNCIVVDGDTSPSDTIFLLADGASGVAIDEPTEFAQFQDALMQVMAHLAKSIVRDGEGATKFITLDVRNAPSDEAAKQIANTIATSPLVKTAFYGNDANWGRIIVAAGRAGVDVNFDEAELWIATGESLPEDERGLLVFKNGMPTAYSEAEATAIFSESSAYITLDLCTGDGQATVWTCDLSHDYVSINADYRT